MEGNERSWGKGQVNNGLMEIVEENVNLVSSIKEKLKSISHSPCICRVPEELRGKHVGAYTPETVSIGPLHHGQRPLRDMENQKWYYLNSLLSRKPNEEGLEKCVENQKWDHLNYLPSQKPNPEEILEKCVESLRELEKQARNCYAEQLDLESDEFVRIMLVDCCFIIELVLRYVVKGLRRKDDPIFTSNEGFWVLRCDLIKLENQIPFFVLQHVFNLVPIPNQCTYTLIELTLLFFKKMIPGNLELLQERYSLEGKHFLDIIRNYYLPTKPIVKSRKLVPENIYSATKLQKMGFQVKPVASNSILDIQFDKGVIKIPHIQIQSHTEIVFRNLIALEEFNEVCSNPIKSYALLMRSLAETIKDVKLLQRKRILLGKKEDVNVFKKVCEEVVMKEDSYYKGICEQINGYGKIKWRIWYRKVTCRES